MRKYLSIVFLAVAVLLSTAHGQLGGRVPAKDESPQLRPLDFIPVPSEVPGIIEGSAKCDGDGSVYFRRYDADRNLLSPVMKLSDKGEHKATFDPSSFSDPQLKGADYFTANPDGELYQFGVAADRRTVYVVKFDKAPPVWSWIAI